VPGDPAALWRPTVLARDLVVPLESVRPSTAPAPARAPEPVDLAAPNPPDARTPAIVWVHRGFEQVLPTRQGPPTDRRPPTSPVGWIAGSAAGAVAVAASAWMWVWALPPETPSQPVSAAPSAPLVDAANPMASFSPAPTTTANPPNPIDAADPSRLTLSGIMASATVEGTGIALISVGDGPPTLYRVGSPVDRGLVVKAIRFDRVELGPADGPATLALALSTGSPVAAPAESSDPQDTEDTTGQAAFGAAAQPVDPLALIAPAEYQANLLREAARRAALAKPDPAR
jgi:hypothetical protein